MKSFLVELIQKVKQFRLQDKKPAMIPSGINWKQVLIAAENNLLSETLARNFLFLLQKDIDHFSHYPEYLHELATPEQFYTNGKFHVRLGVAAGDPELEVGVRFDHALFLACYGITGYGKTNALRRLMKEVRAHNLKYPDKKISVLAFDRKGGDFSDMAGDYGWRHYHVYETLRLSLENPVGMPPDTWINIVASLFCNRAGLNYAWTTLVDVIKILLALMNPQPRERLDWPNWKAILDFLDALPETAFSTKVEYVRSLKQALKALCLSSAKTFSASQGFRMEDLIQRGESAIIHMPNIEPSWVRQLVTDMIIASVIKGRMERSDRASYLKCLFVIDEADDDVSIEAEKTSSAGMSTISECFKKGREFGVGACISISSMIPVSRVIRENATVHLAFRQSDSRATGEAAETLMLPQYGELSFGHLAQGECLWKQIGPWPHAMKVKIDHCPRNQTLTIKYDTHPYKPSVSIWKIPKIREYIENIRAKKRKSGKAQEHPHRELAVKLLKMAADHPFVPANRLFKQIGDYHYSVQKDVCKLIKNENWASFECPRIAKSNYLLIELNDSGYEFLNLPIPRRRKGRGGVSHRFFCNRIRLHAEKSGHKAEIEVVIPGTNHPCDVGVWIEEKLHAYEVCVTSLDVLGHIDTALNSGQVKSLTVVASTMNEIKKIKKELKSKLVLMQYGKKLKFDVISNYMPKESKNETD